MYSKTFSFKKVAPVTSSFNTRYPVNSQSVQQFQHHQQQQQSIQKEDIFGHTTIPVHDHTQIQYQVADRYSDSSYPNSGVANQVESVTYCNPSYFTVQTEDSPYKDPFEAVQQQILPSDTQHPPVGQGTYDLSGVERALNEMYGLNDINTTAHTRISPNATRENRPASEPALGSYSDSGENPDATVIDAAFTASGSHKTTFVKPSPRKVAVKQMKSVHGKRMSQDKSKYISTAGVVEDKQDGELGETSEHSSSDSEKGEEVGSPVSATTHRSPLGERRSGERSSRNKVREKRKRSSDSSSGSSSSSSSSLSSTDGRSPERQDGKDDRTKRTKNSTKSHKERGSSSKKKKSHSKRRRSHCRSRSRSRSVASVKVAQKQQPAMKYRKDESPAATETTSKDPTRMSRTSIDTTHVSVRRSLDRCVTPVPRAGATPSQSSARLTEDVNNVIYNTIMKEKQTVRREVDPDAVSRVTSVASKRSQRRPVVPRKLFDLDTLETHLPEQLCRTELSKHTVKVLYNLYKTSTQAKNGHLIEIVRSISHVPIDILTDKTQNYPQINDRHYLFCAFKREFGHDYQSLEKRRELLPQSLLAALRPKCNQKKDSLDSLFRRSLKEMCEEIHAFEEDSEISIENPVFISGRYLELRLLQKIRESYRKNVGEDVIKYLTDSCPDKESPLKPLVEGSICELYLRKLLDRYDLRAANFDKVLMEMPITPQNMRVWTDTGSQAATNVTMANYIGTVYEEVNGEWSSLSDEEKKIRSIYREFSTEYSKRMKAFIKSSEPFLSDMLKASELMAWMCFGITTNCAKLGTATMAASYLMAKAESESNRINPLVCWNYPLASIHRREPLIATNQPVFTLEEYFSGLEETLELLESTDVVE